MRITIPAGETRVNFSVPVTVDGIFEGTETFNMRLQTLSSAQALGVEVGTQGTAIGEIIDAGIPSIKLFLTKCQHTEQGDLCYHSFHTAHTTNNADYNMFGSMSCHHFC